MATVGVFAVSALVWLAAGNPTPVTAFSSFELRSVLLEHSKPSSTLDSLRLHLSSSLWEAQEEGLSPPPPLEEVVPLWNRRNVLKKSFVSTFSLGIVLSSWPENRVFAFDGGVGGLGKTKPETGVVFRNVDVGNDGGSGDSGISSIGRAPPSTTMSAGDVTFELVSPDGETPVLLSFQAPWPLLRSNSGIESRDLSTPESAFVQVTPLEQKRGTDATAATLSPTFLEQAVFGSAGKFGAYGPPTDIRIKKLEDLQESQTSIYEATFTILTPAMRESERKAYISASVVGKGVFMLISTTTAARFKKQANVLREVASSFACVEAPKTNLRSSQNPKSTQS